MRRKSRSASLYAALKPLLERGASEAELASARKAYRRAYQAAWRKQKRIDCKEFTITLSKDELSIISKASKAHKRSMTLYIKDAALAYIIQQFLVPDRVAINHIRELLTLNYTALQELFDENRLPFIEARELLKRMETLESQILSSLQNPTKHGHQNS